MPDYDVADVVAHVYRELHMVGCRADTETGSASQADGCGGRSKGIMEGTAVRAAVRAAAVAELVLPGCAVDGVFVDEVQDLTPAQIALLRFICPDPTGFVMAGDTAQTVCVLCRDILLIFIKNNCSDALLRFFSTGAI